jgi:hypothetical protein
MHSHCKILRKAPSEIAGFSNAGVERMNPSSAVEGLRSDMLIIEMKKKKYNMPVIPQVKHIFTGTYNNSTPCGGSPSIGSSAE